MIKINEDINKYFKIGDFITFKDTVIKFHDVKHHIYNIQNSQLDEKIKNVWCKIIEIVDANENFLWIKTDKDFNWYSSISIKDYKCQEEDDVQVGDIVRHNNKGICYYGNDVVTHIRMCYLYIGSPLIRQIQIDSWPYMWQNISDFIIIERKNRIDIK